MKKSIQYFKELYETNKKKFSKYENYIKIRSQKQDKTRLEYFQSELEKIQDCLNELENYKNNE